MDKAAENKYAFLYKSRRRTCKSDRENVNIENSRRDKRHAVTNANRNLEVKSDEKKENVPNNSDTRKNRLLKWKKEKEELAKRGKEQKKPFVVGIVRHRPNSPLPTFTKKKTVFKYPVTEPKPAPKLKPVSPRFKFTRTNIKVNDVYKFKALTSIKKLTTPMSPSFIKRETTKKLNLQKALISTNNKEKSSDEELALPLSPPRRITRSHLKNTRKGIPLVKNSSVSVVASTSTQYKANNIKSLHVFETVKEASPKPTRSARCNQICQREKSSSEGSSSSSEECNGDQTFKTVTKSDEGKPSPSRQSNDNNVNDSSEFKTITPTATLSDVSEAVGTDLSSNDQTDNERLDVTESIADRTNTSPNDQTDIEQLVYQDIPGYVPGTSSDPPSAGCKRSPRRSQIFKFPRQKISLRDCPSSEEPQDGPAFQKMRLFNETERLLTLAEDWEKLSRLEKLNQNIIDEIDSVVGQTRLLTLKKFKQFQNLIEQHEADSENVKVTLDDLNGFWEMMYIQVDNLNKRYSELENLKSQNWISISPPTKVSKQVKLKPKKIIGVRSSVRDFIKEKKILAEKIKKTPEMVKRHSSTKTDSPAAYNSLRVSLTAKAFGRTPEIIVVGASQITPKSCLKPRINDSISKSCKKTVLFQNDFKECSVDKTPDKSYRKTPRRSTRLSAKRGKVYSPCS